MGWRFRFCEGGNLFLGVHLRRFGDKIPLDEPFVLVFADFAPKQRKATLQLLRLF